MFVRPELLSRSRTKQTLPWQQVCGTTRKGSDKLDAFVIKATSGVGTGFLLYLGLFAGVYSRRYKQIKFTTHKLKCRLFKL